MGIFVRPAAATPSREQALGLPSAAAHTLTLVDGTLRVIPLGGLGEVGKNMTVFEYGDDSIVVDAGLAFPRDEQLGVDLVLPDFSYLRGTAAMRAVVLTHGPRGSRRRPAVPAARGATSPRCRHAPHARPGQVEARRARPRCAPPSCARSTRTAPPVELGPFRIEFVRMAHSIPDSVAVVIETPAGPGPAHRRLQARPHARSTGSRPTSGGSPSSATAASTCCSATRRTPSGPGMTGSERLVGEAFRQIIPLRQGRILVASFASNIHRMQQAVDVAVELGRKVAIVGRSMRKNMNIARNLGYLDVPEDVIVSPKEATELPPARGADPLHRQPGRADVGADADRLQRPPDGLGRARRHGDHLREARARERAARPRLDQPAREGRRGGAAPGDRARARLGPRRARRSCARCSRSCGRGGDADARRVPDARRARAARARGRRARRARSSSPRTARSSSSTQRARGSSTSVEAGVTFVDGLGVGDVQDVALRDRRRLSEDGVLIVVATVALDERRRRPRRRS